MEFISTMAPKVMTSNSVNGVSKASSNLNVNRFGPLTKKYKVPNLSAALVAALAAENRQTRKEGLDKITSSHRKKIQF